jgi:hypothetical protein
VAILSVRELEGPGPKLKALEPRRFLVFTNDLDESLWAVLDAPGLPRLDDRHPDYPEAVCYKVEATPRGDGLCQWVVTAVYRPPACLPCDQLTEGEPSVLRRLAVFAALYLPEFVLWLWAVSGVLLWVNAALALYRSLSGG